MGRWDSGEQTLKKWKTWRFWHCWWATLSAKILVWCCPIVSLPPKQPHLPRVVLHRMQNFNVLKNTETSETHTDVQVDISMSRILHLLTNEQKALCYFKKQAFLFSAPWGPTCLLEPACRAHWCTELTGEQRSLAFLWLTVWLQLFSFLRGFSGGGEGKSVKEWWKKPETEIRHLQVYLEARQILLMKLGKNM